MSEAPKQVVDKEAALVVKPTPPLEKAKVFRFVKNQNPDEVFQVGTTTVSFRRAVSRDGMKSPTGTFETKDASLAAAILDAAKARPTLYVFGR